MNTPEAHPHDPAEALLGRAALGLETISPEDAAAWKTLVAAQPHWETERRQLEMLADTLRLLAPAAETVSQAASPVPPATLAALEAARQVALASHGRSVPELDRVWTRSRPEPEKPPGLLKRLLQKLLSPGPGLALGATALLAVGVFLVNRPPDDPLSIDRPESGLKSIQSMDIPLASPGVETHFTDPTVLWISLAPEPAQLALQAAGSPPPQTAATATPPATWPQLGWGPLAPETQATLTLQIGQEKTERTFRTTADAKPVAAWLADPAAAATAQSWLKSHPADALTLLVNLAKKSPPTPEQIQWRQQALDASLAVPEESPK